jgi:hypothetical protein
MVVTCYITVVDFDLSRDYNSVVRFAITMDGFMLTSTELKSIKGLLRSAREVVDDAANAARAGGETGLSSRVKNISKRIDDELGELERKLAAAEREEKGSGQ